MKSLIIFIILALLPGVGENANARLDNAPIATEQVIVVDNSMSHFNLAFKGSWDSNDIAPTIELDNTEATIETRPVETIDSDTNNSEKDDVVHIESNDKEEPTGTLPTAPSQSSNNGESEQKPASSQQSTTTPTTQQVTTPTTKPSTNSEETKPTPPPVVETTPTTHPTGPEIVAPAPTEPKKCTNHDMQFSHTTIDTQYQLYNYVTDYYACANCSYTEAESHIDSNGISSYGISQAETEIYNALNNLRESNGLSKLWRNDYWDNWATTRAQELAIKYGHSRPNGGSWTHADGTYYTVGENVASGNSSGYDFYLAFVNSGSHYGTMTIDNAVGVGIGIYVDEQGRTYCAMVLVAPF